MKITGSTYSNDDIDLHKKSKKLRVWERKTIMQVKLNSLELRMIFMLGNEKIQDFS
jgi:hypothetical protein